MNNEPVAWYSQRRQYFWTAKPTDDNSKDAIPLYTTPHHASDVKQTKPLSNSDLDKLVKDAERLKHMEQYIVGLIYGFKHARKLLGQ